MMESAVSLIEDDAIDVSNYSVSPSKRKHTECAYDKTLCDDNRQLKKFLDKCILLDPTFEMENIICKVLLPAYVNANEEYKKSDQFQRVLIKAFNRLINEPERKYSHVSDVLATLKLHAKQIKKNVPRKKVELTTLSNTVDLDKSNRKRHIQARHKFSPKKPKVDVIAIDDEVDVIPVEVTQNDSETTDVNKNIEKLVEEAPIEITDSQEVKIIEDVQIDVKDTKNTTTDVPVEEHEQDKENLSNNENNENADNLLVPRKEVQVERKPIPMTEDEKNKRIKKIESEIEKASKKIKELELAEVTDDSDISPYVQSHKLETRIVKLHKELCRLVDEAPTKTRKVRLQVREGQPAGPVRRLERFLNKIVDEDGVAPFPDFNDVVRCVERANEQDGLGWNKAKILREAQAMFSYCGRALQKRRQQREWRDLRTRVPPQLFDDDPAESDPELRAKLELHKQQATAAEAETLEKFCRLESMVAAKKDAQSTENTMENISDINLNNETMSDSLIESDISCTKESNNNDTCPESDLTVQIKKEPEEFPTIQYIGDISLVIEISDSEDSDYEL